MAKPSLQGRSLPTATGKYLKPWTALASRAITPPCGMIPAAQSEAIMVKSTSSMLGRVSHAWNLMRSGSGCPRASHSSTSSREHECQVDPVVVSTAPIVKTGSTSVNIATRGRRAAWSGKQRPATSSRGGGAPTCRSNSPTNKASCASPRNGVTLVGQWGMARFLVRENATASRNSVWYSCIAIIHQRAKQHKRTAGGLRSNAAPSSLMVSSPLHGAYAHPPVDAGRWAFLFFVSHFSVGGERIHAHVIAR